MVISLVVTSPLKAKKGYKYDISTPIEVDDNELCSLVAARMEGKYKIKPHLLQTISSVETGRWDYNKEKFFPWPWTINANGKGRHFNTKEEAVAAVKSLQAKGIESIDVGCMQISLKYHGNAFNSIEEAFEPEKNVEYSAKFLRKLYTVFHTGHTIPTNSMQAFQLLHIFTNPVAFVYFDTNHPNSYADISL